MDRPVPPPRRDGGASAGGSPRSEGGGSSAGSPRMGWRAASPSTSPRSSMGAGKSPRCSSPVVSRVPPAKSPRSSVGGSVVSPRPNSPFLSLRSPSQNGGLAMGGSMAEDFPFKARLLLRSAVREPLAAAPLPDELFAVFAGLCGCEAPAAGAEEALQGEVVARMGEVELVWLEEDAGHEEVFARTRRAVQGQQVLLECSLESELLPRRQGVQRKDVLRGVVVSGPDGRRSATADWPPPRHRAAWRVVPGTHWGPLVRQTCDSRGRPLGLLVLAGGLLLSGGHRAEGILRQSAGAAAAVRLSQKIFKGQFGAAMDASELKDPLVWGAVLKDYLLGSGGCVGEEALVALPPKPLLQSLEGPRGAVLRETLLLLALLGRHEAATRMSLHSLCLMMLPCLLDSSASAVSDPHAVAAYMAALAAKLAALATHLADRHPVEISYFCAANAALLVGS